MLGAIINEVRYLMEVEVRPPASGARPGMPSSTSRPAGGSIARQMQRPPTPRAAIDAARKQRQLQQAAKQTALRQQRAANQTRAAMAKQTPPQAPSTST